MIIYLQETPRYSTAMAMIENPLAPLAAYKRDTKIPFLSVVAYRTVKLSPIAATCLISAGRKAWTKKAK